MADSLKEPAKETPMQRALRLKKAARAARPKADGSAKLRRNVAAQRAGASKPWMKR